MAKSTTTSCLSSTIYRRNTDQIDWESAKCITYSQTTIKDPHSGFTNLKKRYWMVVNGFRHRTNDLLAESRKLTTRERLDDFQFD